MSNKIEPVAASLRPPLPPRAGPGKPPAPHQMTPEQVKQWDPTGKWSESTSNNNGLGTGRNNGGDSSALVPLLSPSRSHSSSSASSTSSLSSSWAASAPVPAPAKAGASAGAPKSAASQLPAKAVQFERQADKLVGGEQVAPADNDGYGLIKGDDDTGGKGCNLQLPIVGGGGGDGAGRSMGAMSKQCQRQNGIITTSSSGNSGAGKGINYGADCDAGDRYDNEQPARRKDCGLSLSLNLQAPAGGGAGVCNMHSGGAAAAASMFANDNGNGDCINNNYGSSNNNNKIPNAPVGAVSSGGRPLSQAAMNRAKFAIRSYTIATGVPRRARSLVDDARYDTERNRRLLQELRQQTIRLDESLDGLFDSSLAASNRSSLDGSGSGAGAGQTEGPSVKELGQSLAQAAEQAGTDPGGCLSQDAAETGAGTAAGSGAGAGAGAATLLPAEDVTKLAELCLVDFPRHISDLDHCNHLLIKYEPELDPTHPGFHDLDYRRRRKAVAEAAFNYRHGERIPDVEYTEQEQQTWAYIYGRLKEAYAKWACTQHNQALGLLEREAGYGPRQVPQLRRVSEFLERRTGWRLRPVAGLLSARDFLASLAFRVFQTTQYIRHWGTPEHSVEPDCIHELMGHIPMLCDPTFAQFSQELGLASLGASDEQIERFATLYWFTVEFGLCRERGALKCYGAGLLSSFGEMEHALESGKAQLKEFVPELTAVEQYDDANYQLVYYVAESFDEARAKVKEYAQRHLNRSYELAYDPYSCSVKELNSLEQLDLFASQLRADVSRLSAGIGKLRTGACISTDPGRGNSAGDDGDPSVQQEHRAAAAAPANDAIAA